MSDEEIVADAELLSDEPLRTRTVRVLIMLPESRSYQRAQHKRARELDDVCVRAQIGRMLLVARIGRRRQHGHLHSAQRFRAPHRPQHLEAVHHRHGNVQEDQGRLVERISRFAALLQVINRLLSTLKKHERMRHACSFEQTFRQVQKVLLVIDEEDAGQVVV